MKPLNENILVKGEVKTNVTAGGIILTKAVDDSIIIKREVLAVNNGNYRNGQHVPCQVAVGQTVVYSKYARTVDIETPEGPVTVLNENDILAVE